MNDRSDMRRFATAAEFEEWLQSEHDRSPGVWLEIAKRGASYSTVTYAEAVELALCFGWIDGQKARGDGEHWRQRFTPRSRQSRWSQINRTKAKELIDAGRMRPAGLREVDRAQDDGRWEAAYASQRNAGVPEELQSVLDGDPVASAAFGRLSAAERYSIIWRINDAKRPDTRARRVSKSIELLHEKSDR